MGWLKNFLTSSIGKKLVMSLTGLFLILFLVVHLIGNLQLLQFMAHDSAGEIGRAFNEYALKMTTFLPIKVVSYGLYAFILIHAVQGWMLWRQNAAARGPVRYAVSDLRAVNTNARVATRMGWLGTIIFIFIVLHMYQFWLQMKMGNLPMANYGDGDVKDLYTIVAEAYTNPLYVILYVVSMFFIGVHLWHGFQSAFQTLGLNHNKYTPLIHKLGKGYSILVPLGFAIIPVVMYLQSLNA
ncbi:MAG TPA: succinate dehydrogenase cytochrome b subunit [Saprospiraceae bacterium]|jgi:succinate dehydrogenase / fumarate reductase cytochrome b subunit|nr:succinate dehydrogenase cytochrome b subunit [Saprospiraceae bacterium]